MTISLASLAGLPLTAGFMGKMFVFLGLVDQAHWVALGCAIAGAAMGFYYYFRPILAMYSSDSSTLEPLRIGAFTKGGAVVLAAVILVLGVFPRPLQRLLTPAPVVQASAN